MIETRNRVYRHGVIELENAPLEEVLNQLGQPDTIIWADFQDPTEAELELLADRFDLHDIAVEQLSNPHQRPKLSRYDTHLMLSLYAASFDGDTLELRRNSLYVFFTDNWLITVREDGGFPLETALEVWDQAETESLQNVSFLVYALLDTVLDGYSETVEAFNDYYDELSDQVFAENPIGRSEQRQWFLTRRALVNFHRLISPTREVVNAMMYRSIHMPEAVRPYYQDIYDHTLTLTESTEALRDVVTSIAEANLSLRDYRQNQIMKQVTSWAAILAVPTLVTGFYGMNVPFPGYGNNVGLATSVGLIVVLSLILYVVFRRKEWL